jgi:hypothetical protein
MKSAEKTERPGEFSDLQMNLQMTGFYRFLSRLGGTAAVERHAVFFLFARPAFFCGSIGSRPSLSVSIAVNIFKIFCICGHWR